jgi:tetratricopeptide (TPR) repeat protein
MLLWLCPAAYPESLSPETKDLREKARLLEQAGEKGSAAVVYEQIIRKDSTQSDFLSPRIARLYAEAGWTNQALDWAEKAAQHNPDPAAFQAGILTLLGDYAQAASILETELRQTEDTHRKILLYWQLGDVCERSGRMEEAARHLERAATLAKGTPDEVAAMRRLVRFKGETAE